MKPTEEDRDWDTDATEALEAARMLPPGPEKIAALKQAGMLRNIAVKTGIFFRDAAGHRNKTVPACAHAAHGACANRYVDG